MSVALSHLGQSVTDEEAEALMRKLKLGESKWRRRDLMFCIHRTMRDDVDLHSAPSFGIYKSCLPSQSVSFWRGTNLPFLCYLHKGLLNLK